MKTNSTILALSLSALLAFSGSVLAQQPQQPQQAQEPEKPETSKKVTENNNYKTEYFYYSSCKSQSDLQKKLLKTPGVKRVAFDSKNKRLKIMYDYKKAPQATLKKNMNNWGTPGEFNKKPQTKSSKPAPEPQKK